MIKLKALLVLAYIVLAVSACKNHTKSVSIQALKNQFPVAGATGFIVVYKDQEYLLTNWHVLTGREIDGNRKKNETGDALIVTVKMDDTTIGLIPIQVRDQAWIEYRFNKDSLFDIVAFKTGDTPFPSTINKFNIDDLTDHSGDSEPCVLYGFPGDYTMSNNKDRFDTPKEIGTSIMSNRITSKIPWIRFGAAIKLKESMGDGISGSPVFSSNGKLIGIYSSKMTLMAGDSINYGFFWNISAIKQLLDNGTPVNWMLIH